MKTLDVIANELETMAAKNDGDRNIEIDHHLADDLLLAAIAALASGTDQETDADRIREAYQRIYKWYA